MNPFEAMPASGDVVAPRQTLGPSGYRSARGLGIAAIVLFGVLELFSLLTMAATQWMVGAASDGEISTGVAGAAIVVVLAGAIVVFSFIGLAVVFCCWEYRAYANLSAIDPSFVGRVTPGWAVGWWFIPFVQLVMPYFVMKELYQTSVSPEKNEFGYAPQAGGTLVGVYWAAFILRGLFGLFD